MTSESPGKPARRRRVPVTRERALETAMRLADAEGLEALTMRRLAKELGVEAMSLYHHVANKDDILDGMADIVFSEIDLPSHEVDWQSAMRQRAGSLRDALLRHPWALSILESRSSPGPATLRHHDAVLGRCRAAGFSVAMSAHAFSLIDSFVYGFVLQEITLPFQDDNVEVKVEEIIGQLSPDQYPHLTELTVEHILQEGYSYGAEFDFGLNLVLAGLEAVAANPNLDYGAPTRMS
jgi:AcrR family transcriptional regulator